MSLIFHEDPSHPSHDVRLDSIKKLRYDFCVLLEKLDQKTAKKQEEIDKGQVLHSIINLIDRYLIFKAKADAAKQESFSENEEIILSVLHKLAESHHKHQEMDQEYIDEVVMKEVMIALKAESVDLFANHKDKL